ncbi:thioredoxin family protein [Bradyrhizobium diazoefficiens]|uniref:Thioredoxin n=1 Tax=Bradyrhizobium diazoefficiens TaxID=1355477 RepID=A0A809ZYH0_9BRAD|nr:thioredoxin family protein [Bradyrhizobium diazoefficiens]BBZ94113.1 thioredoxin [Bradyrhizobium diazoefficiens]BCA11864.1 thioredoxin [Bradyrhizobium diazoefficiens]BCE56200.1 thioredoxin [Bradyrhizobium diazoefficiens]BCE64938.1 thioredoxin [Bradyrhizobium diazoefficiens]
MRKILPKHKSLTSPGWLTRRGFLALASGAALVARRGEAAAEPALGEDGLYHEPWFLQSFLDLREDLEGAAAGGKRLAIMWELRGCPYCRETHLVNFADAAITTYIRDNFEVLQLNLIGSRKVTDFDRQELSEKDLAQKYGIRFTPTFQFFPPSSNGIEAKEPMAREVARAPGYLKPQHFLAEFDGL